MKKKKVAVLHAQVPFVSGGAELMATSLIKKLRDSGFETDLIQIPYKWYPKNSLYDSMMVWKMLDLSESNGEKIDLVIGTKFPSYGVVHPNKVVWMTHQYRQAYDLYDTPNGLSTDFYGLEIRQKVKLFDELSLKDAKDIYTISRNVSDRLKKYNCIESEPLYHPPSLDGRYYSEGFSNYILSVGRLDALKRTNMLIQSLPHCDKGIRLKIAGRGPEMENLAKLADRLNVLDRVDFLGFVTDDALLELYANALCVYYAPVDEDYGYVTLEAFLSGKPVVTCHDAGGVLEFVNHMNNGYVCGPEPVALAEAFRSLYSDKGRCRDFGHHGYDTVKDISWETVIQKLTATLR